jgi:hypothetical protein
MLNCNRRAERKHDVLWFLYIHFKPFILQIFIQIYVDISTKIIQFVSLFCQFVSLLVDEAINCFE